MNFKKGLITLAGIVALSSCSLSKEIVHENGLEYIKQQNNIEVPKYDKSKGVTVKGLMLSTEKDGTKTRMGNIWEYTKWDRNNDGKYDLFLLEEYSDKKGKQGLLQVFSGKEVLTGIKKPSRLRIRELHEDENFDDIKDWVYLNFNPSSNENLFNSKYNENKNQSFGEMCKMFDESIVPYKFKD